MSMDDFDWSLVLLVEDLLVLDWDDNATHINHRSSRTDKIAYAPQVKSVMDRLSTLEGGAREAYVAQQRSMVLDTLNVPNKTTSSDRPPLTVLRFSVYQKI